MAPCFVRDTQKFMSKPFFIDLFHFGLEFHEFNEFFSQKICAKVLPEAKTRTQNKEEAKTVIEKSAMAGALESSDAQVTVEPGEGLEVNISSSVLNQYGRQIEAMVLVTLERLDVKNGKVTIIDKGALDCIP